MRAIVVRVLSPLVGTIGATGSPNFIAQTFATLQSKISGEMNPLALLGIVLVAALPSLAEETRKESSPLRLLWTFEAGG